MSEKGSAKHQKALAALSQNKRLRRRWITFVRMCRYGVNNFSRNAWLTIAATAVMAITLLIVFTTLVARDVLVRTVDDLRQKVDISIYLKSDLDQSDVNQLTSKLRGLDDVTGVRYISADDAGKLYAKQNNTDVAQLKAISELPNNPFPASLRVTVKDLNNMKSVEDLVTKDRDFAAGLNPDPRRAPSFAGERREIIQNIGSWVNFAERVGIIASVVFIAISILIIFNTIRMAIFNRKEEIQMMKLIGADRSFIRGPFTVEGIMYGFFAALIAFGLGVAGLLAVESTLSSYGIVVRPTIEFVMSASPFLLVGLILLGALIGVISSSFAVRRYLKV